MSLFKELGTPSNEVIDTQPLNFFNELTKVVGEIRKEVRQEFLRQYPEFETHHDPVVLRNGVLEVNENENSMMFFNAIASVPYHKYMAKVFDSAGRKLSAVVKKHTNMSIVHSFGMEKDAEYQAKHNIKATAKRPIDYYTQFNVTIKNYSLNNALQFITSDNGKDFTEEDMAKFVEYRQAMGGFMDNIRKDEDTVGRVDLKKGWVSGAFSTNEAKVDVGQIYLYSDTFATDEEFAAALLHEYGHVFTLYEYIGEGMTFNHVLRGVVAATVSDMSFKDKVTLIRNMTAVSDKTKDLDGVKIAGMKSPNAVIAYVTDKFFVNMRSEWGMMAYDNNTLEGLADQYCARYGAAKVLMRHVMRIHNHRNGQDIAISEDFTKVEILRWIKGILIPTTVSGSTAFVMSRMITSALGLQFLAISGAVFSTLVLALKTRYMRAKTRASSSTPNVQMKDKVAIFFDQHDSPMVRYKRIKEDLIAQIKDDEIPDDVRSQLLRDIQEIDHTLDGLKLSDSPFFNLFGNLFNKLERAYIRKDKQEFVVRQLEELVNNDLFVRSLELKMIADKRSQ